MSAVAFALRAALDHTLPANAGVMAPVRVVAPGGSIVAARPPVAVGAGNVEVSQRVADLCQRALAELVPERVPAAGPGHDEQPPGRRRRRPRPAAWVYYETAAGGQGGRPPRPRALHGAPVPGMSGVHTGMTNTRNTPIEALERAFPVRVLRYRLRGGSGGAGCGGRG